MNAIRDLREPQRLLATSIGDDGASAFNLTKAQAMEIAARVGRMTTGSSYSVMIEYTAKSVTRLANGRVMINDDGLKQWHSVGVRIGDSGGRGTLLGFDDASIREAVNYAETMARLAPGARATMYRMTDARLPVPEGSLWKSSTISALKGSDAQTVRSTALPSMLQVVGQTPFVAAGVLGLMARLQYYVNSKGPEFYYRETDAVCGVGARARDGSSSGWAGAASRDWNALDVADVARRAVSMAEKAVNPVALEPGRRTVILSATAVGQLMSQLTPLFDAERSDLGLTPFSKNGRGNLLGQRITDPRVRLWSDPQDPMGGYIPVWGAPADGMDTLFGAPVPAMTWIDQGVLTNLAYGHRYSLREGKPWNRVPISMHLDSVPGTPRATVDEMIAECKEGLFVNRFSNMSMLDGRSGITTGVTRDGCLLIKNGKIIKAVKNLRFFESPIFVLNKLIAMGTPERVVVDDGIGDGPWFPIIAPPIMTYDFNFSQMSTAI